jgi:hypothetical protein
MGYEDGIARPLDLSANNNNGAVGAGKKEHARQRSGAHLRNDSLFAFSYFLRPQLPRKPLD